MLVSTSPLADDADRGQPGRQLVELDLLHREPRGIRDERGGVRADHREAQDQPNVQQAFDGRFHVVASNHKRNALPQAFPGAALARSPRGSNRASCGKAARRFEICHLDSSPELQIQILNLEFKF